MKKDPDLQINDSWSDKAIIQPERRRFGSGNRKSLGILLIILVILIFAGGIYYFFSRGATDNGRVHGV